MKNRIFISILADSRVLRRGFHRHVSENPGVMDGFSDKRLDLLLKALKKEHFLVDFKAVTTEVNKRWTVLQMYLEMEKERNAYRKMMEEERK